MVFIKVLFLLTLQAWFQVLLLCPYSEYQLHLQSHSLLVHISCHSMICSRSHPHERPLLCYPSSSYRPLTTTKKGGKNSIQINFFVCSSQISLQKLEEVNSQKQLLSVLCDVSKKEKLCAWMIQINSCLCWRRSKCTFLCHIRKTLSHVSPWVQIRTEMSEQKPAYTHFPTLMPNTLHSSLACMISQLGVWRRMKQITWEL